MERRVTLIIADLLLVLAVCLHGRGILFLAAAGEEGPSSAAERGARAERPRQLSGGKLVEGAAGYKYLCFLPKGYDERPGFWPTIVFLHGVSQDEDLEKLKHFGPIKFGLEQQDFPFIAIAPASSEGWSAKPLDSFLNRIQARFRVDRNRLYLTGLSMGGHATWKMALVYPHRFAAIAPVAGAGNPGLVAQRLRHLPVWVFHGQKDTVVPVQFGLMMVRALKEAGGEVKSTIYPDRGHDIWELVYDNPELYKWFLQHRRNGDRSR